MVLAPPSSVTAVRLAGILPPAPDGSAHNELAIRQGSETLVRVVNETTTLLPFEAAIPVATKSESGLAVLRFETQHRFCPAEQGLGPDLRRLGFALTNLTFACDSARHRSVRLILKLLERIERIEAVPRGFAWRVQQPVERAEPGVSVLVPARDTPDLLLPTLRAVAVAAEHAGEPCEIVVVATGVPEPESPAYASLSREFPHAKWIFRRDALSYGPAVELGLAHTGYPWVYLLNSDMTLHPRALAETLALRGPDIFAVGSRIAMEDGSNTETNWTDLHYCDGDAAELLERDPGEVLSPKGCLYVGGGSGLFRRSLLRRFIRRTRAYAPFYWEDVEWGALAWRYGYQCIFCPASRAMHGHRRTVARYYSEREVAKVFERNRLRFHLRNLSRLDQLENRLISLDSRSWTDLFQLRALLDLFWARFIAFRAPRTENILFDRWKISFEGLAQKADVRSREVSNIREDRSDIALTDAKPLRHGCRVLID